MEATVVNIPEDRDGSLEEAFSSLKLDSQADRDASGTSRAVNEQAPDPLKQHQEPLESPVQSRQDPKPILQDGCLPFYRVIHRESMGHYRRSKGIRAGDGGRPPCSTHDEFKWSINDHGWNRTRRPSPWISVTVDLLRAFNFAWQLHCEGKADIVLVMVDPTKLAPGSFMSCEVLRERFGLEKDGLFKTEVLVWQDIPASSIVGEWTFEALKKSQIYQLFPGIPTADEKRHLDALRRNLRPQTMNTFDFAEKLLITLVSDLEMDPSSRVTTQVAQTMLAWTVNFRHVHWIVGFEAAYPELGREVDFGLWTLFRDELSGWDRYLLKRDGCNSGLYRNNWIAKRESLWLQELSNMRELGHWEFGIMAVIDKLTGAVGRSGV